MLASFVELKAGSVADAGPLGGEGIQLLLETIRAQVDVIARLHRSMAATEYSGDLGRHLHRVSTPLIAILGGRIELVEDFAEDCIVQPHQVIGLTQIVAEAITNAVKYAYVEGRSGRLLIRTRRSAAGDPVVEILDDGPGLPEHIDIHTGGGLGFRLIRALARKLEALIELESSRSGLCVRLTLVSGRAFA